MLKKLTDEKFMKSFSQVETNEDAKEFFFELFKNRDLTVLPDPGSAFRAFASNVLPDILANTVKIKSADKLFNGEYKEVHIWKECEPNIPYLVRKPNEDTPLGVIRFSKKVGNKGSMNVYEVRDYIRFDPKPNFKKSTNVVKFNEEKKQMFSVVYKNHGAWRELDTDGEFMTEEEIRKAVIWVAENGPPELNIEHKADLRVGPQDARVIEFYQTRTGWKEGDLEVRKGDLVSTTQFYNDSLWEYTKDNFETYSMEGTADSIPLEEDHAG